jgi:hypothetical protein
VLRIDDEQRSELRRWDQSRALPSGNIFRARMILAMASGNSYSPEAVSGGDLGVTSRVHRRERIEAAIVEGGRHISGPHEAWIAADPLHGDVNALITAHGLERTVTFALDYAPVLIAERVRDALEEYRSGRAW